jgi:hypothetical protein
LGFTSQRGLAASIWVGDAYVLTGASCAGGHGYVRIKYHVLGSPCLSPSYNLLSLSFSFSIPIPLFCVSGYGTPCSTSSMFTRFPVLPMLFIYSFHFQTASLSEMGTAPVRGVTWLAFALISHCLSFYSSFVVGATTYSTWWWPLACCGA